MVGIFLRRLSGTVADPRVAAAGALRVGVCGDLENDIVEHQSDRAKSEWTIGLT